MITLDSHALKCCSFSSTDSHCSVKYLGFLSYHQSIVYNRHSTHTVFVGYVCFLVFVKVITKTLFISTDLNIS